MTYYFNEIFVGLLILVCPLLLISTFRYVFMDYRCASKKLDNQYQVKFKTIHGIFKIDNIRRGASVIGLAGRGKSGSGVDGVLKHFRKQNLCGIIHDTKDFELNEMALPHFKDGDLTASDTHLTLQTISCF